MGKKGKGRQSGEFGSKNLRAAHTIEWQTQVHQVVRRNRPSKPSVVADTTVHSQRPRLTRLGQLKGILRERQFQESYELFERRRRAGFVPALLVSNSVPITNVEIHPPGWILNYGKVQLSKTVGETNDLVGSLQSKCLLLLSRYILEYLDALGKEQLHSTLALLPTETLAALSEAVSKGIGVTDDLAFVLGKHTHAEELCFRSTIGTGEDNALTDKGILELVPRLPSILVRGENDQETWDDWEEAYLDNSDDELQQRQLLVVDALQLEGVNVGLKRLELVDCLYISADAVLALLEKCACITHLSLAGSIQGIDDAVQVIRALPELLPSLQVLDVTRCGWMSISILTDLQEQYRKKSSYKPPIVHCQGCFLPEEYPEESTCIAPNW